MPERPELRAFIRLRPAPKYGDRPAQYTAAGALALAQGLTLGMQRRVDRWNADCEGPPLPYLGPVAVEAVFLLPEPRKRSRLEDEETRTPDSDKLERLVNDVLSGIVFGDDKQIVHSKAWKAWLPEGDGPRVGVGVQVTFLASRHDLALPWWGIVREYQDKFDVMPELP